MTSNGRVARLTALALATGTLVAAGAGTASAATSTSKGAPLQYGQAVGSVLRLEINLPVALPGNLLPQHIVQDISLTDGTVSTLTSAVTGNALAALGSADSNIPVVSNLLAGYKSSADLKGDRKPAPGGLVHIDQNGLKLDVLPSTSLVNDPTTTLNGVLSASHSAVANIDLSVPGLSTALGPVISQLTSALGSSVGSAGSTSAPVAATVTNTLNTLSGQLPGAAAPVASAINQVSSTLSSTLNTLQGLPTALADTGSLLHIAKLNSDRSIVRAGDAVTATSSNALSDVQVLGGLVTVQALTSTATATAAGVAGKASAPTPSSQIVHVKVAGVADLILDKTGIHLGDALGNIIPGSVTDAVNGALSQLQGAISLLGISVQDGVGTSKVSADGRSAEAHASGAAIAINPLKAAAPLVRLSMVNSNALVAATPVTLVHTVGEPVTIDSTPMLPRTGANLPLTGAIATGLVGLAMVARRRRLAHLAD
ncbi:MAG: hypothetical protein JWM02_1071 [Frankiales bacterium]|nr:hypothetical protein [Frankiales bacterium]